MQSKKKILQKLDQFNDKIKNKRKKKRKYAAASR